MIIPKKTKEHGFIDWLSKALDKSENQKLNYLYIDTNTDTSEATLVACDGHRLHKIDTKDFSIESGLYIVSKTKDGYILTKTELDLKDYPNWNQLIPDLSTRFTSKFTFSPLQLCMAIAKLVYVYKKVVSEKYLSDALSISDEWDIYVSDGKGYKSDSIVFCRDEYFALLMPLRFLTELVEEDKKAYEDFIGKKEESE